MTRVGDVRLGWGESLVCDERRQRLYFVDCQASTLHWLDDDDATLQRFRLPSMPTGIVPADEGLPQPPGIAGRPVRRRCR